MKKEAHKTFVRFLSKKKYTTADFLEPVLFLPYAYGLTLLPKGLDKTELIIWLVLVFVWGPLILFLTTRRRKKK